MSNLNLFEKREMLYRNLKLLFNKFVGRNIRLVYRPSWRSIDTEEYIGNVDLLYDDILVLGKNKLKMVNIRGIWFI